MAPGIVARQSACGEQVRGIRILVRAISTSLNSCRPGLILITFAEDTLLLPSPHPPLALPPANQRSLCLSPSPPCPRDENKHGVARFPTTLFPSVTCPPPKMDVPGTVYSPSDLEAMTTTYQTASTITYNPHNTRFRTLLEPEKKRCDSIYEAKATGKRRYAQGCRHV